MKRAAIYVRVSTVDQHHLKTSLLPSALSNGPLPFQSDHSPLCLSQVFGDFDSSIYSFAPTVLSTSRKGNGNRFREGSRTTFGAESWYFLPRVLSSHPPAASTFFTHSDWPL